MEPRTTIGLKVRTKKRLDAHRAPGQCYEGFICQLVDLWEKNYGNPKPQLAGPSGENQSAGVFSRIQ